ncbi:MAG: ABC transporter substrate-binding protein [Parasporobacterium sp.]|nr:ABC transporter substrate-binding protein [Parasporobacterium sp.]
MKKVLAVVLGVCMMVGLLAGFVQAAPAAGVSQEKLVVAVAAEPTGLVDALAYTSNNGAVTSALFDTLVFYDSTDGGVRPMLAESWEMEDDVTAVIHLVQNAVDFEGNPITTEDVLYSFQIGAESPSVAAWYQYYDVANFEIVDDYTMKIRTFRPYSQIINVLSNKAFAIVSKDVTEAAGGAEACLQTAANGTGMYKLQSWTQGENMILVRNEDYYGEKGYFDTIEFKFIPDAATRAASLQSGEVQVAQGIAAATVDQINATEGVSVKEMPAPVVLAMAINTGGKNAEAMSNPLVREALSYAINREAILMVSYMGHGEIADSMFPSNSMYYQPAKTPYTYDPEKAKALLEEAGYGDGSLTVDILVNSVYNATDAEVIQNNLQAVGVNCELELLEIVSWIQATWEGQYDCIPSNFFTSNPLDLTKTVDSRVDYNGRNFTGVKDEVADAIIERAEAAVDPEEAKAALNELNDYMVYDNFYCIPLVSAYTLLGMADGITNVQLVTQGDHAYYGMLRVE